MIPVRRSRSGARFVGPGAAKILRLALVLALLSGCAGAATPLDADDITLASALVPFEGCEALTGRIREHALEQVEAYGMAAPDVLAGGGAARAADDAVTLEAAPQAGAAGAAGADGGSASA